MSDWIDRLVGDYLVPPWSQDLAVRTPVRARVWCTGLLWHWACSADCGYDGDDNRPERIHDAARRHIRSHHP